MPDPSPRSRRSRHPRPLTARTADIRRLYEASVQNPEAELDFVERVFRQWRGRRPVLLREDFCATAATAIEWVRRRRGNRAVGVDLDPTALWWARRHHVAELTPEQRSRFRLIRADVRAPGPEGRGVDAVLAMNFSYWILDTREAMRRYFRTVRASLVRDGVFFLDQFGGWAASRVQQERRRIAAGPQGEGFTYVWDQHAFDAVNSRMRCFIHFEFKDGTRRHRAFKYEWRLWTIPEIRELLLEAGFRRVGVFWENDNGKGGGNGVFRLAERAAGCETFIAYIVAAK